MSRWFVNFANSDDGLALGRFLHYWNLKLEDFRKMDEIDTTFLIGVYNQEVR